MSKRAIVISLRKHQVTARYHCSVTLPSGTSSKPETVPGNTRQGRSYRASPVYEALSRAGARIRQGGKMLERREVSSSPVALSFPTNMHPPPIFVRPSCHRQVGGEANAASSRVQWVTRSCTPVADTLNMHKAPWPCHHYRYIRTRIRFRVGSSSPARSHFS